MPVGADEYVLSQAMDDADDTTFPVLKKDWLQINDSNNGSYTSSQIQFSSSGLSNSGQYFHLAESILILPLVLQADFTGDAVTTATSEQSFFANLRSGLSVFNSLSLKIASSSCVEHVNLSNMMMNYRMATEFSPSDVEAYGPTIYWAKEDGSGLLWHDSRGVCNNHIGETSYTAASAWGAAPYNVVRRKRLKNENAYMSETTLTKFGTAANMSAAFRSYIASISTTKIVNYITLCIPLKFLHPVFSKIPLCKNVYWELQLNTHLPFSATHTIAGAATTESALAVSSPYGSCPFMESRLATTGSGFVCSGGTNGGTMVLGMKTVSYTNAAGTTSSHSLSQCRIMAAVFKLDARYESALLKNPVKRVVYEDYYYQQVSSVANAATVSHLLVHGIARPRALVGIAHFANNGSTTTGNGDFSVSVGNSPYFSGDLPCPLTAINAYMNFQVLINGQPVFNQPINYNFEHFSRLREAGRINGGLSTCINGLITEYDHSLGLYGYCYVDLSRHPESEDDKNASVLVQYRNDNARTLNYHWFIIYERELKLDIESGQVVL